jgi:hypothetical protein
VHGKSYPLVFADMLWSAARHRVGFNDYMEFDFAILTRAERATWVTSPLALELSNRYDDPAQVHRFHNKIDFNRDFDRFLGASGSSSSPAMPQLEAFAQRHPVFIAKVPVSKSGLGVRRYDASDVADWEAFHAELLAKGEVLIEERIVQHADLEAIAPARPTRPASRPSSRMTERSRSSTWRRSSGAGRSATRRRSAASTPPSTKTGARWGWATTRRASSSRRTPTPASASPTSSCR